MKKIKNTKPKNKKNEIIEEEFDIKKLSTVFLIILSFFVVFYGITMLVLSKTKKDPEYELKGIEIASNDILASDILNQKEELYYVLAINDNYKDIYNLYTSNFTSGFYNINLENALNKSIISTETNISDNIKDIKISDTTLFVVAGNTISEYYVGMEDVVNKLKTIEY